MLALCRESILVLLLVSLIRRDVVLTKGRLLISSRTPLYLALMLFPRLCSRLLCLWLCTKTEAVFVWIIGF